MMLDWNKLKLQFSEIAYVISLLLFITFIDRLIILDLPFSTEFKEWHWAVYVVIVSCLVCILSLYFVKKKEKRAKAGKRSWNEKIMLMITNTGKGNFLDILVLFSFLAFAAWIPDTVFDFVKDGQSLIRIILYVVGLVLLVWGKPSIVPIETVIDVKDRKLLLTGMSQITNAYQNNIYPLIEPLKIYTSIEKLVILLSNSIWLGFNRIDPSKEKDNETLSVALSTYKQKLEKLNLKTDKVDMSEFQQIKSILEDLLKTYIKDIPAYKDKDIEIVFSDPVDYNNFDKCNDECYYLLKEAMRKGKYDDSQVVVNVSPGTAVVTSAMTLNAIKGNRAMIYTTQDSKHEVISANPKATLIQFESLIEEREFGGAK